MDDNVLAQLRLARAAAIEDLRKSRELSLVLTKIDEAILWRQQDLQVKSLSNDGNFASTT